jgi:ATP-dependent RNA helicase SUPV3L1/SUV3
VKLIKKMNYKTYEKDNNLHFRYIPLRKIIKKDTKKNINDNPFNVLSQLNLK